jgi:hypothetical protein
MLPKALFRVRLKRAGKSRSYRPNESGLHEVLTMFFRTWISKQTLLKLTPRFFSKLFTISGSQPSLLVRAEAAVTRPSSGAW